MSLPSWTSTFQPAITSVLQLLDIKDYDIPAILTVLKNNNLISSKNDILVSNILLKGKEKYITLLKYHINTINLLNDINITDLKHLNILLNDIDNYKLIDLYITFESTHNQEEFYEALLDISKSWRADVRNILDCISYLKQTNYFTLMEIHYLENFIYDHDYRLIEAYEIYITSNLDINNWNQLILKWTDLINEYVNELNTLYISEVHDIINDLYNNNEISLLQCNSLRKLADNQDETLMATMSLKSCLNHDEIIDTLLSLSTRWLRDPDNQELLNFIDYVVDESKEECREPLKSLVLNEDETLLAGFDIYKESDSTVARLEFCDLLTRCGLKLGCNLGLDHMSHLASLIQRFGSTKTVNHADMQHLNQLMIHGDLSLEAGFEEFKESGDIAEFFDTLTVIGHTWREDEETDINLRFLQSLIEEGLLSLELDYLETMIYFEDPVLMTALFEPGPDTWPAICDILNTEVDTEFQESLPIFVRYSQGLYSVDAIGLADYLSLMTIIQEAEENNNCAVLSAISAEYSSSQDSDEFYDSLYRLARKWRRNNDYDYYSNIMNSVLSCMYPFGTSDEKIFHVHDKDVLSAMYYLDLPVVKTILQDAAEIPIKTTMVRVNVLLENHHYNKLEEYSNFCIPWLTELHEAATINDIEYNYLYNLALNKDDVLMAAFDVYSFNGDLAELTDSVCRIGDKWHRGNGSIYKNDIPVLEFSESTPYIYSFLEQMDASQCLDAPYSKSNVDSLIKLLYDQHPALLAAYDLYADNDFDASAWIEFFDTMIHLVQRYNVVGDPLQSYIDHIRSFIITLPISQSEIEYLLFLLAKGDETLEAALSLYHFELSNSNDQQKIELELADTLISLSFRFRRTGECVHENDDTISLEQRKMLYQWIFHLRQEDHLLRTEYEILEYAVFHNNPVIVLSWLKFLETNADHCEDDDDESEIKDSVLELWTTFSMFLDSEIFPNEIYSDLETDVLHIVETSPTIAAADALFLSDLVSLKVEQDANDQTLLNSLLSGFHIFVHDNDEEEWRDTVLRVGKTWRRQNNSTNHMLSLFDYLKEQNAIDSYELEALEMLLLQDSDELYDAYVNYEFNDFSSESWDQFLQVVSTLLGNVVDKQDLYLVHSAHELVDKFSDTEIFSQIGSAYLHELASNSDPVLMAIVSEYSFGNVVLSPEGDKEIPKLIAETEDSLWRLSRRWRRHRLPSDSIPVEMSYTPLEAYLSQEEWSRVLDVFFDMIESLASREYISFWAASLLEDLIILPDLTVWAAFCNYMDDLELYAGDDSKLADSWQECWDTITQVLKKFNKSGVVDVNASSSYVERLSDYIGGLFSEKEGVDFPFVRLSDSIYLRDCLIYQSTLAKSAISDFSHRLHPDPDFSGDVAIEAILANYQEDGDVNELRDSLSRLALRWRRIVAYNDPIAHKLLSMIHFLYEGDAISSDLADILDYLVYVENHAFFAAFTVYLDKRRENDHDVSSGTSNEWGEFWDTLCHIVYEITGIDYGSDIKIFDTILQTLTTNSRFTSDDIQYLALESTAGNDVLDSAFRIFLGNKDYDQLVDTMFMVANN